MIISASRRTDIPAYYSEWFMRRIREGYCTVPNPYNSKQIARVSLKPSDVDVFVFWTKNAGPMFPRLGELDALGYKYYFQYTVTGYPAAFEPSVPRLDATVKTFGELAERIGPDRVIWRYDPIIISNITGYDYHREQFSRLAELLRGKTQRVVVSIVDEYRKASLNFKRLASEGIFVGKSLDGEESARLMNHLVRTAKDYGLEIYSCSETVDLRPFGILPGKCIDDDFIGRVFGIDVNHTKDKFQRKECGCVVSKDIGAYDACLHGCTYCYASTINMAKKNYGKHFPDSPSLLGRYEALEQGSESVSFPEFEQMNIFD